MQAGSGGGGMPTQQQIMDAKQKETQQEEMRSELLQKILTADAKERIKRLGIVKPEKVCNAKPTSVHPQSAPLAFASTSPNPSGQ